MQIDLKRDLQKVENELKCPYDDMEVAMKTTTFAKCLIQIGPFTTSANELVEDRNPEPLKKKWASELIEILFYDIHEIVIDGVLFTSEPINLENVVVVVPEINEPVVEKQTWLTRFKKFFKKQ